MNLLEYILLLLLCGPIAVFSYSLGLSVKRMMTAKKVKACTFCPSWEDAERGEVRINSFLKKLAKEMNVNLNAYQSLWYQIQKSKEFIWICHALGYELVIRQVDRKDIEEEKS